MDSITQAALGAAVGVAVMGRRTAVWKAAAIGAVIGTLPDLDSLVDHGDPVANMTYHRAETHALFWQTLASLPIAAAVARVAGERAHWRRWWLAVWLILVTHALLDAMTVYGTQLLLPFTDRPLGVASIFIIDPLYTLPLVIGLGVAVWRGGQGEASGLKANVAGLAISAAYLAWTVGAQAWVRGIVTEDLRAQGVGAQRVLVTPAPFNTLLWRVVAVTDDGERYLEGFRSLFDGARATHFDAFGRGQALAEGFEDRWHLQRVQWFSRGFYRLRRDDDGALLVTDLRMGQEPIYVFTFRLPPARDGSPAPPPQSIGYRVDIGRAFQWLIPRAFGADLPPPRAEI